MFELFDHRRRKAPRIHLLVRAKHNRCLEEDCHVSIHTTCGYKAIPIQTKREALRKFYLFDQSWQDTKSEAVDWNHYPDLLAFLESL